MYVGIERHVKLSRGEIELWHLSRVSSLSQSYVSLFLTFIPFGNLILELPTINVHLILMFKYAIYTYLWKNKEKNKFLINFIIYILQ